MPTIAAPAAPVELIAIITEAAEATLLIDTLPIVTQPRVPAVVYVWNVRNNDEN